MGGPKALLPFGAETLIERVVRRMAAVSREVIVVSGPHLSLPVLPATVRVVEDEEPLQGPLAGILYGLRAATGELSFVCGCDHPLLAPAVAGLLVARAAGASGAAATWGGRVQPLVAAYRKRVTALAAELLAGGERRALALVERAALVAVPPEELRCADPTGASFFDVDTPQAYAEALRRLSLDPA